MIKRQFGLQKTRLRDMLKNRCKVRVLAALNPAVAEAAVVGRPDELKGEGIVAFVTLEAGRSGDDSLIAELRGHVGKEIGPIARPDVIKFTDALPKTRSGKIMRRILRALAAGQEVSGDTSTLEDRSVLDALRV